MDRPAAWSHLLFKKQQLSPLFIEPLKCIRDVLRALSFVLSFFFKKDFIYLFLDRGEGREKERERNNVWLPLMRPLLGTWPSTQACALTGNQTRDPLVHRLVLSPLSHTSQGSFVLSYNP